MERAFGIRKIGLQVGLMSGFPKRVSWRPLLLEIFLKKRDITLISASPQCCREPF